MNRKVLLSGLLLLVFSITGLGTYSFLVNKSTNSSVVSTGDFPAKLNAMLYTASGPLFDENTPGHQNQQSLNYPGWLQDASKYIIKELTGQVLESIPANEYQTYKNITDKSNTTSRKETIVSANFYSWKGEFFGNDIKENGTTMHHIAVFENSKRLGDDSPKLNLKDLKLEDMTVDIRQYDVFTGMKSKEEYTLERPNTEINAGAVDNRTRVRTFDYINGKYVQTFQNDKETTGNNQGSNGIHPAEEADLIIYDIGGEGYYAPPSAKSGGEQETLNTFFLMLCGKEKYHKNEDLSAMGPIMDSIIQNEDGLARLDRTVSEITVIKNGKVISTEENTIRFSETE